MTLAVLVYDTVYNTKICVSKILIVAQYNTCLNSYQNEVFKLKFISSSPPRNIL